MTDLRVQRGSDFSCGVCLPHHQGHFNNSMAPSEDEQGRWIFLGFAFALRWSGKGPEVTNLEIWWWRRESLPNSLGTGKAGLQPSSGLPPCGMGTGLLSQEEEAFQPGKGPLCMHWDVQHLWFSWRGSNSENLVLSLALHNAWTMWPKASCFSSLALGLSSPFIWGETNPSHGHVPLPKTLSKVLSLKPYHSIFIPLLWGQCLLQHKYIPQEGANLEYVNSVGLLEHMGRNTMWGNHQGKLTSPNQLSQHIEISRLRSRALALTSLLPTPPSYPLWTSVSTFVHSLYTTIGLYSV